LDDSYLKILGEISTNPIEKIKQKGIDLLMTEQKTINTTIKPELRTFM